MLGKTGPWPSRGRRAQLRRGAGHGPFAYVYGPAWLGLAYFLCFEGTPCLSVGLFRGFVHYGHGMKVVSKTPNKPGGTWVPG